jgi:hypothetical protein
MQVFPNGSHIMAQPLCCAQCFFFYFPRSLTMHAIASFLLHIYERSTLNLSFQYTPLDPAPTIPTFLLHAFVLGMMGMMGIGMHWQLCVFRSVHGYLRSDVRVFLCYHNSCLWDLCTNIGSVIIVCSLLLLPGKQLHLVNAAATSASLCCIFAVFSLLLDLLNKCMWKPSSHSIYHVAFFLLSSYVSCLRDKMTQFNIMLGNDYPPTHMQVCYFYHEQPRQYYRKNTHFFYCPLPW